MVGRVIVDNNDLIEVARHSLILNFIERQGQQVGAIPSGYDDTYSQKAFLRNQVSATKMFLSDVPRDAYSAPKYPWFERDKEYIEYDPLKQT